MQKIQHIAIGSFVKADVTGTGGWLSGHVSKFDKIYVWFNPINESREVKMMREQTFIATDTDTDTDTEARIRLSPDMSKYVIGGGDGRTVTITNRKTVDINDVVAVEFRAELIDAVYNKTVEYMRNMGYENIGKKGKSVPITVDGLKSKYGHLNLGMQRMNLGNLIRNAMVHLGLDELPNAPVRFV